MRDIKRPPAFREDSSNEADTLYLPAAEQQSKFAGIAINLITATVILAWPALFNGHPLGFDDTGSYL